MGNILYSKRASIALAAYNGSKYISNQIESILTMLGKNDELVISYDKSSDDTLSIIESFAKIDTRIKIVFDSGKSVESNFNSAVQACCGEYIFLSDQDDVWIDNKINKMVSFMDSHPNTVVCVCDGYFSDEQLNLNGGIFDGLKTSNSPIRNFIKGSYLGCQMMFRASIKTKILPFVEQKTIAHDLWLGVLGAHYGDVSLIKSKLIIHRLHDSNYSNTSKLSFFGVIKNRLIFFFEIEKRIFNSEHK
jgi:glycosyltransferase involved in cell wall biosynthesis